MFLPALKLITDYLQNRKQRTKIGSICIDWEDIISGVPQGSILGLLLFNIFLCDLFLDDENNYFANYADDTTPYSIGMFHSRCLNNKVNRLHERCLRMIYNDKISNFKELLNEDNSVSKHHNIYVH